MANPRYLIGQGEKLSEEIARPPRGMGDKAHPYDFTQARARLFPQFKSAGRAISNLPDLACPDGQAVLQVTLHPSYLAKSYYPSSFMRELNLKHLGSRAAHIKPEKVVSKRAQEADKAQPAPVLFLAGDAERLIKFSSRVQEWAPASEAVRGDFRQIEAVSPPGEDRLKRIPNRYAKGENVPLEVVLHSPVDEGDTIVSGFAKFIRSLDLKLDVSRRRQAGGLCFLPLLAPRDALQNVLSFSFLRVLREMPRIAAFEPLVRATGVGFDVPLRGDAAVAPDLAVAIFDGGLPPKHGLDRWVTLRDAPGVGAPVLAAQTHGLQVTSAFLFGPLSHGVDHAVPYSNVDHWRVLGADQRHDDFELLSVLDRIENVLSSRRYDFVNISLGPDCAIDDDDVNVWTSSLDQLLAGGDTLATVACGNNGERDRAAKLHRIQPPSDGVNILAIGAADLPDGAWKRAPYSAEGPGRSPGFVKPDFISFGGSHASPFLALHQPSPARAAGTMGTSFASPLAMRSGAGVRAQFAEPLWAPTVKALLVHNAQQEGHDRAEVGWGKVSHAIGDLVLCDDYEAHVVYQRQMPETGAVRFYLPIPPGLTGNVEIKATFSFFCEVDPEDAINYTRAGLEVQFRPNTRKIPKPYRIGTKLITPTVPATDTFFSAAELYADEHMRRDDAQKWETTLSRSKTKRVNSLNQPAFDVSLLGREHGQGSRRGANMKVALVLTLRNRHAIDLSDRVVASSANRLQPMKSRAGVTIPARLSRR
jgi:hypothetical protein